MNKIINYTIGADPEMFLIDTSTGDVICAKGIIPGEKGKPFTDGLPKGFGLEIDGILAEFNIPPCTSTNEYIDCIHFMKSWIRDFIKNINPNYDLMCKASAVVTPKCVADPAVNIRGCDPDFDAYTEQQNPRNESYPGMIRCAGDHIHIGYDYMGYDADIRLIKMCDLTIGLPSVFIDNDTERRKLYGKAGCYRNQPWGIEYRTLSSRMLEDDGLEIIAKGIERAIDYFNNDVPLPDSDLIQRCINTSNKVLAEHLVKLYKDELCVELLG